MQKNAEALTIDDMKRGVDEEGRRIQIFTSALTNEKHAMQANYGHFDYDGATLETGNDQFRMHTSNLKDTVARHGYGSCVYSAGSRYDGQWDMDRRQGSGVFTYTCGDVYTGEWVKGKYHGKGTYKSATGGDNYEGQWKEDRCDGHGTYIYVEKGEKYEGEFIHGLRSGFGKYTYSNGNFYVGQYKEGEKHGVGTFYFHPDGDVEMSRYVEGKDAGEGVRWSPNRAQACRTYDGVAIEFISLADAAAIATKLGLRPPAVGPPETESMRPSDPSPAAQSAAPAFATGMTVAPGGQPSGPPAMVPPSGQPTSTTDPAPAAGSTFGFTLPGLNFGADGRIQW